MATTREWCAWVSISPDRSPSVSSMPVSPSARSAGSAWESPSNPRPPLPPGLPEKGLLPVFGTYATFAAARNLDQIRTSICYGNFNVLIAGAHGGVSVGPDGATHQALEDLFAVCGLPNMSVVVPCDAIETRKATDYLLLKHQGPKYIRFAREATPVVTDENTPFEFGRANVIRLRREGENFKDAFETMM